MKAVQLHSHAEQTILQKRDRTQTGLLLGQSWDHRVYVLAAVPTPPLPKSENGGGGGWNRTEWFLEHARQVRRMLVGGVELIGMFVADADAERLRAFEADGALRDMAYGLPLSPCALDRIVLRAGGGSKGVTGEFYTGAKKDVVKPKSISSIKVAPIAPSLVLLETTLHVDVSVPVHRAGGGAATLKQQLRRGLEPFQASVLAAAATINGHMIDSSTVLEKVSEGDASSSGSKGKSRGGRGGGKAHKKGASAAAAAVVTDSDSLEEPTQSVEFFLRPSLLPAPVPGSEGVIRIQGACHCRVYAHGKSTVGQALLALKHDVLSSLQARLRLVCEDSEDSLGEFDLPSADAGAAAAASFTWFMPRRLFQPLVPPACVCDYLLPHETPLDGVGRIEELLGASSLAEAMAANAESFTIERCADEMNDEETQQQQQQQEGQGAANTSSSSRSAGEEAAADKSVTQATKPAGTSNGLMLPIAFGVLALALSAAFFSQIM